MDGTCVVQLNDTTTVFLGGRSAKTSRQIALYDWSTNKLSVHKTLLESVFSYGRCEAIDDENRNKYVYYGDRYLNKNSTFAFWNPSNGDLQTYPVMPLKENTFFQTFDLTTINSSKELLIYGGSGGSGNINIWKFNFSFKTWTKTGEKQNSDELEAVRPIKNLTCS